MKYKNNLLNKYFFIYLLLFSCFIPVLAVAEKSGLIQKAKTPPKIQNKRIRDVKPEEKKDQTSKQNQNIERKHTGHGQEETQKKNKTKKIILLNEFIRLSAANDPNFPLLLSQELDLKFQKDLQLPASDIVLDLSTQYDLFLPLEENSGETFPSWEGSVSLQKLFPSTGTSLSATYSNSLISSSSGALQRSAVSLSLSQSLVQNAFGILTRMQEKKIDIDADIIRYQVLETYEEYMSSLIQIYIDWYRTEENLRAGRKTLEFNRNLLHLVQRKQRFRIALPEDVYKIELEVLISQEDQNELIRQNSILKDKIRKLTGVSEGLFISPKKPSLEENSNVGFNEDLSLQKSLQRLKQSRTFRIMGRKEQAALLARDIAKRSLLPELNAFVGYQAIGLDYNLQNNTQTVYAGISSRLNFGKQQERANLEIKKIELQRQKLQTAKDLFDLNLYIKELHKSIANQRLRIISTQKKLELARKILYAEQRNYNIGRKPLSDLIVAKKSLESTRYDLIQQETIYQGLILEYISTLDLLVSKKIK